MRLVMRPNTKDPTKNLSALDLTLDQLVQCIATARPMTWNTTTINSKKGVIGMMLSRLRIRLSLRKLETGLDLVLELDQELGHPTGNEGSVGTVEVADAVHGSVVIPSGIHEEPAIGNRNEERVLIIRTGDGVWFKSEGTDHVKYVQLDEIGKHGKSPEEGS
jgi:hypothetical protein